MAGAGGAEAAARFSQADSSLRLSSAAAVPTSLPLTRSLAPSSRLSYFLSSSSSCFFPSSSAETEEDGVFTSCAPRGSATVYLNSDLRSDTGLKLAEEVSRCRCIQNTVSFAVRHRTETHETCIRRGEMRARSAIFLAASLCENLTTRVREY